MPTKRVLALFSGGSLVDTELPLAPLPALVHSPQRRLGHQYPPGLGKREYPAVARHLPGPVDPKAKHLRRLRNRQDVALVIRILRAS
jgi:hypothetical protein